MENLKKITVSIKGMHCVSCELLIEEELKKIPEVVKIQVNHRRGEAVIYYGMQRPNPDEVNEAIRQAGYETGPVERRLWLTRDPDIYKDLGLAVLFLIVVYVFLKSLGVIDFNIATPSNTSELGTVLLIGLTAGFSTCLALVGSVVLGLSARHAESHPEASTSEKFRPHIYFNLGRLTGFVFLGGLLGLAGSLFQLNPIMQGILTILVGIVMLLTGLKLTGLFPVLEKFNLTLPKGLSEILGIKRQHTNEYSHSNSFWLGALTFFLPCGFTQSMQLLAISSGSFWAGAVVMGLFTLGTMAGLLAVGGVTSVVKGVFARRFFKFAGLAVIVLSIFNISNGLNLTGWKTAFGQPTIDYAVSDPNVNIVDGVQEVRMEENYSGYLPNKFTIHKDIPVKWIINAKAPASCAASLVLPELKIQKTLRAGENIIEFMPNKAGRLSFSCAMGMYTGYFEVVDVNVAEVDIESTEQYGGRCNFGNQNSSIIEGVCEGY